MSESRRTEAVEEVMWWGRVDAVEVEAGVSSRKSADAKVGWGEV